MFLVCEHCMPELFVIDHSCCIDRPVLLVPLVHSAQTLQPRPSHVQMDLTAWVLRLFAPSAQLVTTVKLTAKTLFRYLALLVITATNQQSSAQIAVLDMLARVQILLQRHHPDYAHWVISALMVCEKIPVHQVHMET